LPDRWAVFAARLCARPAGALPRNLQKPYRKRHSDLWHRQVYRRWAVVVVMLSRIFAKAWSAIGARKVDKGNSGNGTSGFSRGGPAELTAGERGTRSEMTLRCQNRNAGARRRPQSEATGSIPFVAIGGYGQPARSGAGPDGAAVSSRCRKSPRHQADPLPRQ